MKIGIVTFHNSDNCGSMLQAYALQTVLEKNYDCKAEIIDFSSRGQRQMYSLWDTRLRPRILKSNIRTLPHWGTIKKMKKDYAEFSAKNFHLTKKYYKRNRQLFELNGKYDILIAGGDQVWNVRCRDTDLAYFLNFADKGLKVAYSPSLGAVNINKFAQNPEIYRDLLLKFDYLSVREPNGKKWLEDLTGKDIPIIADPTMLFTPEQWLETLNIQPTGIKEKFIFYYAFSHGNRELNERLRDVAKELGLKVLVIDRKGYAMNNLQQYGFELYEQSGPYGFLKMINEATAVVTDSFHGTLFSALFNKNFCNFKHNVEIDPDDDRSAALLKQLGLENHYVLGAKLNKDDLSIPTDYDAVSEKIAEMRSEAMNYINTFMTHKAN